MAGRIHGRHEVVVGGPVADVVIDVTGRGHAGSDRLISPIGLAAINVVAGHRRTRIGSRRIPLQENAMRVLFVFGRNPEEHHAGDSEKKDRQNRNR